MAPLLEMFLVLSKLCSVTGGIFFAPHVMCLLQNKDCFDPERPKKLNEPADFVAATMERLQVIIWRAARLKN